MMRKRKGIVRELLRRDLNRHQVSLERDSLKKIEIAFGEWRASEEMDESEEPLWAAERLCTFLTQTLIRERQDLQVLRKRHAEFTRYVSGAFQDAERRRIILDYAGQLGATGRELRRDARAFSRWFDADAVTDRFHRRRGQAELEMRFGLGRLGSLARFRISNLPAEEGLTVWRRLALEHAVSLFMEDDADSRVRIAAFRCLSTVIQSLPAELQGRVLSEDTLRLVMRVAQKTDEDVWIQSAALELLGTLSPPSLGSVLRRRFQSPAEGDDIFVRRRAAGLLASHCQQLPEAEELIPLVLGDSSPYVRQGLAMAVSALSGTLVPMALPELAQKDPSPQVRAAAIVDMLELLDRPSLRDDVLDLLRQILAGDDDDLVLRVAMYVATEGAARLSREAVSVGEHWCRTLERQLDQLRVAAPNLATRRRAAQSKEKLWCARTPRAAQLRDRLAEALMGVVSGGSRRIPRAHLADCTETEVGRVLSVLAQDDFGLEIRRGWLGIRLFRGDTFRLRMWRILYELRHPSPDKRQGFPHTIGRVRYGDLRAPSALLAELTETRVPGEPVFMEGEGGWRPYLPLVDDALSSLNRFGRKAPVRVCSSEGMTELYPPASLWRRLWAHVKLSFQFAHYARLRNWNETAASRPEGYLQALSSLGFKVQFRPHDGEPGESCPVDPAVARFFPALGPLAISLPSAGEFWEEFSGYFVSVYENSIFQLIVFMALLALFFLGKHLYLNVAIRRSRKAIPLSFGGWGTRGKSGTERLKAGLVHDLGYGFVSKTTGCEAMFIYGLPFGKAREMFLFRPYDKASIWEQASLIRLGARLPIACFLWECMALAPRYVRILQRHWMKDELATITNAYPDHEDIQGPAGVDLPRVMGEFMPRHGQVFTTEDQMLPILEEEARARDTTLINVGWIKANLLTSDVLARFPYQEHPSNIALVLRLAEELGIEEDVALKGMADHVIPDLGVLKTYPTATLRTRSLEFSNGMSANERHGCLSNWKRLKLSEHDLEREPNLWITTVVNNRADRLPRSQVFARILVADISADRHLLIGANLKGLMGYIQAEWQTHEKTLTLFPNHGPAGPEEVLADMARRMRMPTSDALVRSRLRVMLEPEVAPEELDDLLALAGDPQGLEGKLPASTKARIGHSVVAQLEKDLGAVRQYRALLERLSQGEKTRLDDDLRELMRKWFFAKIVVLEDYFMTGDQLIERLCDETPPHFHNRIVGLQNIKGTGLDFAYRWQAWDACHRAGQRLLSADAVTAKSGLQELAAFQDYGLVCEEFVRTTVEKAKRRPFAQTENAQAELGAILVKMERKLRDVRVAMRAGGGDEGMISQFVSAVEGVFDAGDAVRRRKKADRIYDDLVSQRISLERASFELRELTKRQKGGWLVKRWKSVKPPSVAAADPLAWQDVLAKRPTEST